MKAPTGIVTKSGMKMVKHGTGMTVGLWNSHSECDPDPEMEIYMEDLDEVVDFLTAVRDELRAEEVKS